MKEKRYACYPLCVTEFLGQEAPAPGMEWGDWDGLEQRAEEIHAAGFSAVELSVANPVGFDQDRLWKLLHEQQLSVAALSTAELAAAGLSLAAENPWQRRVAVNRLNTLAGLAAQCAAVVVIGAFAGAAKEDLARAEESLRAAGEYAVSLGVSLALCSEAGGFSGGEIAALLRHLGQKNIGAVLSEETTPEMNGPWLYARAGASGDDFLRRADYTGAVALPLSDRTPRDAWERAAF